VSCEYQLYLPSGYGVKSARKWPLVIFLHGSGGGDTIEAVTRNGLPWLAARYPSLPFVLVSPRGTMRRGWGNALPMLNAMLDEIIAKYKIDPDRVYLTGQSLGGIGTYAWCSANPERFAAAVPICGNARNQNLDQMRGIPVWAFHGAKDAAVPVGLAVTTVDALKQASGDAQLTIYPEVDHASWVPAYNTPELYAWMLRHRRDEGKVIEGPEEALPQAFLDDLGFERLCVALAFDDVKSATNLAEGMTFSLPLKNATSRPIRAALTWDTATNPAWTVTPTDSTGQLAN